MSKKKSFELAIKELSEIVEIIDSGEIDLQQSVKLYKKGVELSVYCNECLNAVEEEVTILKQMTECSFTETQMSTVKGE